MGARSADPGARGRPGNWRLWWFVWRKKIAPGVWTNPGCPVPPGAQDRSQYHWGDSGTARPRTGTGTQLKDDLERVSRPAREADRGRDFFTVEVWTRKGLQRFIVLSFLDLSTRQVEIAGLASTANGLWMSQIGRNVTDAVNGILLGKRYLIHDRDPLFTAEFLSLLAGVGVESVKLPPRSPNLNAHAERFVRSIKESCLERLILFGENSLRKAASKFVAHYHAERPHQGLGNRLIRPEPGHLGNNGALQRRQRLGGMLNYYYRAAA